MPAREEPYQLPGTTPALEPASLPNRPLTADQAKPLIPKVIA